MVMLVSRDVYVLINYFSVTLWLWTGVVTAGMVYLRLQRPELYRPIKFYLILPIVFTLGCFLLTAVAIWADKRSAALGLLFMAFGLPVYYVQKAFATTQCGKCSSVGPSRENTYAYLIRLR